MKIPEDDRAAVSVIDEIELPESDTRSWRFDRWLVRRMLQAFSVKDLKIHLWDGYSTSLPGSDESIQVVIRDRSALYQIAIDPDLKFGEMYSEGRVDIVGDLVKGLEQFYRSYHDEDKNAISLWRSLYRGSQGQRNTIGKAKHNIHHHYDVGNDFYRLWLEKEMQYTCAYYPAPDTTLGQAQVAKLDHVCRKLNLQPGQTVAEAGCGWGGLARHMAVNYKVKVKSYNISHEQIVYATERAKREGYDHLVEYVEDDYRQISGTFDRFVSVGMLEHVGKGNYAALGDLINKALKDDGIGMIHSIGQMQPRPVNAWLRKHIFPGGYPPSLGEMMEIFEAHEFSVWDVENLRLHYAKTLEHWLERFENHSDAIHQMYDKRFYRIYKLYLASSKAAFLGGGLQLFQITFGRCGFNHIPWTRMYMYPRQ